MKVETYGKGTEYSRVESVVTRHTLVEYRKKFGTLLHKCSRHIIPSWFLTNVKVEIMQPMRRRQNMFHDHRLC